jgi:hypothetical protein
MFPEKVVNSQGNPKIIISLAHQDIFHKMVTLGRGGFCFEQNNLLSRALNELGFTHIDHIGVRCVNRSATPDPREGLPFGAISHLILIVHTADGNKYLVDNGFAGSGSPRRPLSLCDGLEVTEVTGEMYRLVNGDVILGGHPLSSSWGGYRFMSGSSVHEKKRTSSRKWFLQYKNKPESEWWDIYHFDDENFMSMMDCELGIPNTYLCIRTTNYFSPITICPLHSSVISICDRSVVRLDIAYAQLDQVPSMCSVNRGRSSHPRRSEVNSEEEGGGHREARNV